MDNILNWISENQQMIYIVVLMVFLGIEIIGRVPSLLHTPLMSGAKKVLEQFNKELSFEAIAGKVNKLVNSL